MSTLINNITSAPQDLRVSCQITPCSLYAFHKPELLLQMIEGALHNLYAEKEPIRSEAIKDTVDWIVARI